MDVYFVNNGGIKYDMYCRDCADNFIIWGGDPNDVDGPYADGGGEADLIHHCDRGGHCINAMNTVCGPRGVCFHNDLTPIGIEYTINALAAYIEKTDGILDILDLWAEQLLSYSLTITNTNVLYKYDRMRAVSKRNFYVTVNNKPNNQPAPPKNKKKQDTEMHSLIAFFDTRRIVHSETYCKSCKDTGVIILFNSSVECTDCAISKAEIKCI